VFFLFISLFFITSIYNIHLLAPLFPKIGIYWGPIKYIFDFIIIIYFIVTFRKKILLTSRIIKVLSTTLLIYLLISIILHYNNLLFTILLLRQYLLPLFLFFIVLKLDLPLNYIKRFIAYLTVFLIINWTLGIIMWIFHLGFWDNYWGAIGTGEAVLYCVFIYGVLLNSNISKLIKLSIFLFVIVMAVIAEVRIAFLLIPLVIIIQYIFSPFKEIKIFRLIQISFIAVLVFITIFKFYDTYFSDTTTSSYGLLTSYSDVIDLLTSETEDPGSRYFLGDLVLSSYLLNQNNSFMFGTGFGSTTGFQDNLKNSGSLYKLNSVFHFRSQFGTILTETGVLGITLFLSLFVYIVIYSQKQIKFLYRKIKLLPNLESSIILFSPPFLFIIIALFTYEDILTIQTFSMFIALYAGLFFNRINNLKLNKNSF